MCTKSILLLISLLPPVYLHSLNGTTITCSAEAAVAKTVFDFWHESSQSCEVDALNLYRIYKKFEINPQQHNKDENKIADLLHGHVGASLMQTLFSQLISTISTKSFNTKSEIENIINDLYEEKDKSFVLQIWQKVLDETYLFVSEDDLLQQILPLTNTDLKVNLLEYLLIKYENHKHKKINSKFLPLLTFGVTSVLKQRQQSHSAIADPSIGRLLGKLPEQLLNIYQAWNYNVSILNGHYNEYVFSERLFNDSLAVNKRFLFHFLPNKNYYRVKGKFKLQFNARGHLTFGVFYENSYKYLIAENNSTFICLDCGIDSASQWWQVLWGFNDTTLAEDQQYVLFENLATKELLCSTTTIVNENVVLISVLDFAQHMHDSQCHWKVIKRIK